MVEIEKSANDKRLYKFIKLENGLQAILISDPDMQVLVNEEDGHDADSDMEESDGDAHEHDHEHGPNCEHEHEHNHDHGHDCACCEHSGSEEESGSDDEQAPTKNVKKAAAALAVNVGSFSDPWDIQGLSHYLEHMLFMGSEKFPDENEYDSFLASHGGCCNAFTEMELTNYHFDVSPAHLHGALERFAQFFIAPLCKADALDREVQAVNNEFTGVGQNDEARLAQLRSHTAKPDHLYRKFTWGNSKSLVEDPGKAGIDVRKRLVEYYKQEYSAERMRLAVLGSESLETLEGWVKDLFSQVPSGKGHKPSFQGISRPYEEPVYYLLPSVHKGHQLVLTFQLPSLTERYLAKADEYISSLVGHEGKGSLLSLLKSKGWATGLSAGVSASGFERNTGLYLFDVTIELTEAGLRLQNGLGAAQLVFEFLAMLRREGPQKWFYQELADVGAMRARFKEEQDAIEYVAGIVTSMLEVQPQHVLVADDLFQDWDPELITSLLDEMVPSNCRFDLQTSSFKDLIDTALQLPNAEDSVEPWFRFHYVEADIPSDLLLVWEKATSSNPDLLLPPRNNFIPTDFALACDQSPEAKSDGPAPAKKQKQDCGVGVSHHTNGSATVIESELGPTEVAPKLEIDEKGLKLWHLLDTTFRTPRSVAYWVISTPSSYESPRAAAMTALALRLLHDSLKETTYLADVAGLDYAVATDGVLGIQLKFSGFSHKLPLLVSTVMSELSTFKASESNFERVKEAKILKYRNANISVQPHATYLRWRCIKRLWDVEDVLKELEQLSVSDIQAWVPQLWASIHLEAFVAGNCSAETSQQLAKSVSGLFHAQKMTSQERPRDQTAHLPAGSSYLLRQPTKNVFEANSAIEVYFQCGPDNRDLQSGLDLIEQILSEPCFNVLRTQEQLGYSVHCGVRLTNNILGFAFAIVSGSHDPDHLNARVEAFLTSYLKDLENMSEKDFDEHRQALIDSKLEKDNCLQDQADRHWDQIVNRRYQFQNRLEEVEILRTIAKKTIVELYKRYLLPGSPDRARLAVQVVCKTHATGMGEPQPGVILLKAPEDFRSSLEKYPAAK